MFEWIRRKERAREIIKSFEDLSGEFSYFGAFGTDLLSDDFNQIHFFCLGRETECDMFVHTISVKLDSLFGPNAEFIEGMEDSLASMKHEKARLENFIKGARYRYKTYVESNRIEQKKEKISAYGVLGIKPGATVIEVKKAYRTTCKRVHPDAGGSEKEFILVQRAYEFIMSRIS